MRWILHIRVSIIIFLAVVLISAAIMFSVLRALLPHATGYKNEIQQEISQQVGLPVEIDSIDAAIHWFSPRLKLIGVRVYDEQHEVPLFDFDEAFVELDVIASILYREFIVDDVGLVGADISIEKFSDSEWSIQGVRFSGDGSGGLPDAFWYMLQNSDYLLHDSNIYYQDHTGDKLSLRLLDVNIDVENNFNNHDIRFSMSLPADYGHEIALVANLSGDIDKLDGDIYIEADQIKLKQWDRKFKLSPDYPVDADLDVDLWLSIEDNAITVLTTQFVARDLQVVNSETSMQWQAHQLSSSLRYVKTDDGWNLVVSDLIFGDRKKPDWPVPSNIIAGDDGVNYYLSADFLRYIDVQDIVQLFADSEQLTGLKRLRAYELQADVYNLELLLPKKASGKRFQDTFHLSLAVNDLAFYDRPDALHLSGLDARFVIDKGQVVLDLDSDDVLVELPELFRQPLFADNINGKVKLVPDDIGWRLSSDSLQLKNAHINTVSRLDIRLLTPQDIRLDVQTDFDHAYARYAKDYLPVGVMSDALVDWLDMAVTDGYVPAGRFILHGDPADFPFDGHQGVFQVLFDAEKINMKFLPDWPEINDAVARIKFENRSLHITDMAARTQSASLFNGHLEIPDLTQAHLTVHTDARSKNEDVQTYIWNSPLDDMLGDALRLFQFTGNSSLRLKIDVPLYVDDIKTAVDGNIKFTDTDIYYPDLGYELDSINGKLSFTQDSISADAMQARIQDEPVTLSASTRKGRSGQEVVFHLDGELRADYLLQRYDSIPEDWLDGASPWSLDIEVPYEPEDYLVHVKASSSLDGVGIHLSDKIDKAADERISFSTAIDVLENHGLRVEASANRLTEDVAMAEAVPGKNESRSGPKILNLLALREEPGLWNFDIDAKYLAGKGELTEGLGKDTDVVLDLKYIDLHALLYSEGDAGGEPLQPNTFPPLRWHFDALRWNDWHLTDVELETDWHKHGMLINRFSLSGPALKFQARGTWLKSWTGSQETVLQGSMSSDNVGSALKGLGFEQSIDRATFNASFDAKWPAAPYGLSWSNMEGQTSFKMKDGEVLEVNPGAGGRLLGLMNIFKLASRLALDFDDLTRKGFSFDYINGEFDFVDGDGSLEKFDISAPAADVNMFGSIGLVKKDYGLLMQVKPHTDTLTFAGGALLGGVAVGAGLALIQKVFDLGVIGNTVYSITGSWDDPHIEKIVERNDDTDDEDF